jgi:hypothetical protein
MNIVSTKSAIFAMVFPVKKEVLNGGQMVKVDGLSESVPGERGSN